MSVWDQRVAAGVPVLKRAVHPTPKTSVGHILAASDKVLREAGVVTMPVFQHISGPHTFIDVTTVPEEWHGKPVLVIPLDALAPEET